MSFLLVIKSFLELINKIVPDKEERKRRIKEKRKVLLKKADYIEKQIKLATNHKTKAIYLGQYADVIDSIKQLDGVLETY